MCSQVSLIFSMFDEVAQHQTQCSIFANQQLKVSNIFPVHAVFGRSLLGFRSIADPRSWTHLQIAFTEQSFQPISGNFCNNYCSVFKTKFPQCLDLSFIFERYFTHDQSYSSNCDYDLNYGRIYCNAMLHVNKTSSQRRWYLLLNYFNNKINFLFSCEIRSRSLHFRQFDICRVNTAQSNTLVYSIVTNKWAKFDAKKIFRHFWDIAIFVFGYFILPHLV